MHIVDGTTITMADTVDNQLAFPQQSVQKPGLGFPICRVVGITCLSTGVVKNAAIGRYQGKGSDEQTLLRTMQHIDYLLDYFELMTAGSSRFDILN